MIEKLIGFFKQHSEKTKDVTPKGLCPNCWGKQEYDNKIRKLYKDKQIDVNNNEANYAFVQDFVVTRLNGIKLVKGNSGFKCPTCGLVLPF